MSVQISLVLVILGVAVVLFVSERLRVDVVALLVLVSLAATGLVSATDAFAGFSSPAVVTIWAMFILSGGLSRTGVATMVGNQIMRLAPGSTTGLMVVLMLAAGVMSAFMNNVGVAALLLPVVMDIARRTRQPPSKLLMPLAYASLLGGLVTLIGTPPNILISDALRENGLRPFQMFDYTPIGVVVMLVGIVFMALAGRVLLPTRATAREFAGGDDTDLDSLYDFDERLFILRLPANSPLAGKTLAESRLGSALGVNVTGILRDGEVQLAPVATSLLMSNDRLLVAGSRDRLDELHSRQQLIVEDDDVVVQRLVSDDAGIAELRMIPGSKLEGKSLVEGDFRGEFGVNVLAIIRNGVSHHTEIQDITLQAGDRLLIQGAKARLERFVASQNFAYFAAPSDAGIAELTRLNERLVALSLPDDSLLAGRTLVESRLGDAFDLTVVGIERGERTLMPDPETALEAEDTLLVAGETSALTLLRSLRDLEIDAESPPGLAELESEDVGIAEAVLSPHTQLAGRTLRQLNFREKYGLSVLAIWRGGRAYRSNLREMALRLGDALLLHGPREKFRVLGQEPDFLVLTQEAQEAPLLSKAPLAILIMAGVLVPVIAGWLPIAVAGVAGAVLMVLTGCLSMDDAYRYIEWRAVFLIAGMLPLGIAMEQSGAASFLAEGLVGMVGGQGPLAVAAAFYVLAALASQVMPNPAVAVLLAPIALTTASDLGLSPFPLMMTVALSASASFLSPVAHPANVLIMGPGGYRFSDYIRVGLPLTLVVMAVTLAMLPLVWPF